LMRSNACYWRPTPGFWDWPHSLAFCMYCEFGAFWIEVPLVLTCRRFEMLAFKSDVSHWRQKKEMVGVSVRYVSPVLECCCDWFHFFLQHGMLQRFLHILFSTAQRLARS
jgi:hypothetical protein